MSHKSWRIAITHNFETAHRLSFDDAPVKCQSIHGHSWWVTVELAGDVDAHGLMIEFGALKKAWRALLDESLDHHLVVHVDDPVAHAILKVQPDARILMLDVQPSTEMLAQWIHEQTQIIVDKLAQNQGVVVVRTHLQETRANAAAYVAESA